MPDSAPVLTAADPAFPPWLAARVPALRLRGAASLLAEPPVALVGSRQCPGAVLLAAAQWADDWAQADEVPRPTLASGFQTPVEQEVLHRLLRGSAPMARFPARTLPKRLPAAQREAMDARRLVIASAFPASQRRPTKALATRRNDLLGKVARAFIVLHAAPESRTLAWTESMSARGVPLYTIDHTSNAPLFDLGAAPLRALLDV